MQSVAKSGSHGLMTTFPFLFHQPLLYLLQSYTWIAASLFIEFLWIADVSGQSHADIYRAIYEVRMSLPSHNYGYIVQDSELMFEYVCISDGTKSFVSMRTLNLNGRPEIEVRPEETYIFTDCNRNIALTMKGRDTALTEIFLLRKFEFDTVDDVKIGFYKEEIATKTWRMNFDKTELDKTIIQLYTSHAIPEAVNLGSCYFYPIGLSIMGMNGKKNGVEILISLKDFYKTEFDFSRFEELYLKSVHDPISTTRDLFWD